MDNVANNLASIFNLSSYEAKIYLAALNFDKATLTDIAKRVGMPRTAAYPPLQTLLKRGFLSIIPIKKRKYYQALEPKQLQFILDKNKIDLDQVISELSKSIFASPNKLAINYFSGAEGITVASDIFLNETKTKLWKTFEHPIYTMKTEGYWQVDEYVKKRVENGIRAKVIIPAIIKSDWIKEHLRYDKEELRETILVSPQIYPLEATIAVTKGIVLLIAARNNQFAVLIKNEELSDTINSIHDMVWDRYKI